jgi:hypothetical protein
MISSCSMNQRTINSVFSPLMADINICQNAQPRVEGPLLWMGQDRHSGE